MLERIGGGVTIGFPIFELDTFNNTEKHHLSFLDYIFVCSEWAKQVVIDNDIVDADRVSVVPLGVDTEIFKPNYFRDSQKTIFLNAGKWEVRKGHDILPSMFNTAFTPEDNVELHLMTENPFPQVNNQDWLSKYMNTPMGRAGKIKYITRVKTHNEVYNVISKAHCGIFPARAEGWNLELLEMMACGAEVITTNVTGHTEFINKECAYTVDCPNKEVANDGIWFNGQGMWHSIGQNEFDEFVNHMRDVHEKCKLEPVNNQEGIEVANRYSWANSAQTLVKTIEEGIQK